MLLNCGVGEDSWRVPWTAWRSKQSILKDISPDCSLEGLMLFGHLMQRADSFERPWCLERLKAGEEGDNRGWDGWMASPTQWTWVWLNSGSWWWRWRPGVLHAVHGVCKELDMTEWLNWTELSKTGAGLFQWKWKYKTDTYINISKCLAYMPPLI